MVSKIIGEDRGSGMTRHTRSRRIFDLSQPLNDPEMTELSKGFQRIGALAGPWRWLEHEVNVAERTIRQIDEGVPGSEDPDIFKPHAGPGWYSREIIDRAKWISNAKEKGEWELVARFSYELGQLASTVRLKNVHDGNVRAGIKHRATRESANAANRLASDAKRRSIVVEIIAERGRGVRDACAVAAERFRDLGTRSTFKESYYKKGV